LAGDELQRCKALMAAEYAERERVIQAEVARRQCTDCSVRANMSDLARQLKIEQDHIRILQQEKDRLACVIPLNCLSCPAKCPAKMLEQHLGSLRNLMNGVMVD
jgi:hypothetical protein